MDVRYGCTLWTYAMDVRYGCRLWNYAMDVRCGCTLWMYAMDVGCGITLWMYDLDVRYGCRLWNYAMDAEFVLSDSQLNTLWIVTCDSSTLVVRIMEHSCYLQSSLMIGNRLQFILPGKALPSKQLPKEQAA